MKEETPRLEKSNEMGMELDKWNHKSCTALIGIGDDWATIYMIQSEIKRQGHASELLQFMKNKYEQDGKEFGSSVALNENMRNLLTKFKIQEYK